MGNLNIFLSEFFCQALQQSSCAKLTSSKCTRDNIASRACRSSGEDQSTLLSTRFFDVILLECQNGAAGKGESVKKIATRMIYSGLGNFAWIPSQGEAI